MSRMARWSVRERQRLFWVQVRLGLSTTNAAEVSGVPLETAKGWFRKAGGMPPMPLAPPVSVRYLSLAERRLDVTHFVPPGRWAGEHSLIEPYLRR